MIVQKWLTISKNCVARITTRKPDLGWDEISIFLEVNVPDALFTRPRLEAKIDIPSDAVGPDVLSSCVVENVREAIEQRTGLQLSINVIREEEEKE